GGVGYGVLPRAGRRGARRSGLPGRRSGSEVASSLGQAWSLIPGETRRSATLPAPQVSAELLQSEVEGPLTRRFPRRAAQRDAVRTAGDGCFQIRLIEAA